MEKKPNYGEVVEKRVRENEVNLARKEGETMEEFKERIKKYDKEG